MRVRRQHEGTASSTGRATSLRSARWALPAATTIALAAAVPAAGPAVASPAPFTTCASDAQFRVESIDIEPQPLVPGKKVRIQVAGTLVEQLTAGSYDVNVTYLGVNVQHVSGSIGELTTLPTGPGPMTAGKKLKVPKEAPGGSYELQFNATDQNGATLTCVRVPFEVR